MVTLQKPPHDPHLARAEALARWLDDRFLDPLLGFFLPGIGDLIGTLLGFYVVGVGLKKRVKGIVIARMLLNLGVDALVGLVPLAGDLFDVGWKANKRNVALLRNREAGVSTWRDWLAVLGALAVLVLGVTLTVLGVRWLWGLAFGR
jgi:uncharacterized protein DUF4112